MNNLLKNWKTTSTGATMIIGAIVHLVFVFKAGKMDEPTVMLAVGAILAGLGFIFAGDASASAQSHTESQAQIAELQLRSNIIPNAIESGDTSLLRKVPITPAAVPPPVVPPEVAAVLPPIANPPKQP